MNNLKILILLLFFSIAITIHAQEEEKESIITDRPDQTESAFLVPKGNLQIETGFQYKRYWDVVDIFQLNTTLFRYGLFRFLELRLNVDYSYETCKECIPIGWQEDNTWYGFEPIVVGVKIPLVKAKGIIPQIAFLGHLALPIASEDFKQDNIVPDFRLSFENTISDRFTLGYNLGMDWDIRRSFIYTIALGIEITDKFGAFVEPFGNIYPSNIYRYEKSEHYLNGGLTYLIKNNIQLDGFVGTALTHQEYFAGVGFSIRIPD